MLHSACCALLASDLLPAFICLLLCQLLAVVAPFSILLPSWPHGRSVLVAGLETGHKLPWLILPNPFKIAVFPHAIQNLTQICVDHSVRMADDIMPRDRPNV